MDPLSNPRPKSGIEKSIYGIWIVGLLLFIALLSGGIYVAVHFLSKVW